MMELSDIKAQGSQLKTVRQKANIFKNWLLSEVDLNYIRRIKRDHPAEFFRGVIQSLPKDLELEISANLIQVIKHLDTKTIDVVMDDKVLISDGVNSDSKVIDNKEEGSMGAGGIGESSGEGDINTSS